MTHAYRKLEERYHQAMVLQSVEAMLDWDTAVMMPPSAAPSRGEQMATLRVMAEESISCTEVADLLEEAATDPGELDGWQQANLRAMRRLHLRAAAVPSDTVAALARTRARCEAAWRGARDASDFAAVAGTLEELLGLVREAATAQAQALGCTPYEALVDEHEPGLRQSTIDELFDALAQELPALREDALAAQGRRAEPLPLVGPFGVEAQRRLGERMMDVLGFERARGRLDVSTHPFCGGTPDDVRITTRYDTSDFSSALMGVLHETGHALYELGLPAAWRHQPVGQACGMAVHESQSLLMEMQVCRARTFLNFAAPLIRDALGKEGPVYEPENLYRLGTRVAPGLIRVDADEVTYPAHVVLRYELERAMVAGTLSVADLPGAWNDGMERLLGLRPPDDRRGCLQDIHWFDGAFGYFPSYTLGAMTAAQLFAAATANDGSIAAGLSNGDFAPLLTWLRSRVHGVASSLTMAEIVHEATGEPLSVQPYLRHLRRRYVDDQ